MRTHAIFRLAPAFALIPLLCLAPLLVVADDAKPAEERDNGAVMTKSTPLAQKCLEVDGAPFALVSPDARHCAAVLNDENGKQYISLDGKKCGDYVPATPQSWWFSPDSQHFAYAVKADKKSFCVIDSAEGKKYDEVADFKFSPDSKRVAYTAKSAGKWFCVIDGAEGKPCDSVEVLLFSPDSQHTAFHAVSGGKHVVVLDGKEKKPCETITASSLVFSPDSKRLGHIAWDGKKWLAVVDDAEGKQYDTIDGTLMFSADSKRVAYTAKSANKALYVVNGVEEKPYDAVGGFAFSPDSQHYAYWARKSDVDENSRMRIVSDGAEQTAYLHVGAPVFSPDSKHLAYPARRNEGGALVKDGKEGEWYASASVLNPCFSPDSQRVAYGLGQSSIVVDGAKYKAMVRLNSYFVFSPDSRHFVFITLSRNDLKEYKWTVDGKVMFFSARLPQGSITFDSPDTFHVVTYEDNTISRIDYKIKAEEEK
jgi:WD40 repeat protein